MASAGGPHLLVVGGADRVRAVPTGRSRVVPSQAETAAVNVRPERLETATWRGSALVGLAGAAVAFVGGRTATSGGGLAFAALMAGLGGLVLLGKPRLAVLLGVVATATV